MRGNLVKIIFILLCSVVSLFLFLLLFTHSNMYVTKLCRSNEFYSDFNRYLIYARIVSMDVYEGVEIEGSKLGFAVSKIDGHTNDDASEIVEIYCIFDVREYPVIKVGQSGVFNLLKTDYYKSYQNYRSMTLPSEIEYVWDDINYAILENLDSDGNVTGLTYNKDMLKVLSDVEETKGTGEILTLEDAIESIENLSSSIFDHIIFMFVLGCILVCLIFYVVLTLYTLCLWESEVRKKKVANKNRAEQRKKVASKTKSETELEQISVKLPNIKDTAIYDRFRNLIKLLRQAKGISGHDPLVESCYELTLIKLINNMINLENAEIEGRNILESKQLILEAVGLLESALAQVIDSSYESGLLNLQADVKVLSQIVAINKTKVNLGKPTKTA